MHEINTKAYVCISDDGKGRVYVNEDEKREAPDGSFLVGGKNSNCEVNLGEGMYSLYPSLEQIELLRSEYMLLRYGRKGIQTELFNIPEISGLVTAVTFEHAEEQREILESFDALYASMIQGEIMFWKQQGTGMDENKLIAYLENQLYAHREAKTGLPAGIQIDVYDFFNSLIE